MSDPTFEFHPKALVEAWEARRWYSDRNPQTAAAFLAELDHAQGQVTEPGSLAAISPWDTPLPVSPISLLAGLSRDAGSHHCARSGPRQTATRLLEGAATRLSPRQAKVLTAGRARSS